MSLEKYTAEIERYIPQLHQKKTEVSKVDVAWQLDHSLNVLISVTETLENSDPDAYEYKLNPMFEILCFLHWIPRGKGRSPKIVLPKGEITESSLKEKLKLARDKLKKIPDLPNDSYFPHPYFGHIKKKRAIRFLGMHTQHHLKIVKDIVD